MRIRPVFLLVLCLSYVSVLIFTATFHPKVPAILRVHLEQRPSSHGITNFLVHLSDTDGTPIEQATVASSVSIIEMDMGQHTDKNQKFGKGDYRANLQLNMSGSWTIIINAEASGFVPLHHVVVVDVV